MRKGRSDMAATPRDGRAAHGNDCRAFAHGPSAPRRAAYVSGLTDPEARGHHEAAPAGVVDEGRDAEPPTPPDAGPLSGGRPPLPALVAHLRAVGLQPARVRSRGARGGHAAAHR